MLKPETQSRKQYTSRFTIFGATFLNTNCTSKMSEEGKKTWFAIRTDNAYADNPFLFEGIRQGLVVHTIDADKKAYQWHEIDGFLLPSSPPPMPEYSPFDWHFIEHAQPDELVKCLFELKPECPGLKAFYGELENGYVYPDLYPQFSYPVRFVKRWRQIPIKKNERISRDERMKKTRNARGNTLFSETNAK